MSWTPVNQQAIIPWNDQPDLVASYEFNDDAEQDWEFEEILQRINYHIEMAVSAWPNDSDRWLGSVNLTLESDGIVIRNLKLVKKALA